RQQVHAEQDAGVGRADEDAVGVGQVGGVDAAERVLRQPAVGRAERLLPDDLRQVLGVEFVRVQAEQLQLRVLLGEQVQLATQGQWRAEEEGVHQVGGGVERVLLL